MAHVMKPAPGPFATPTYIPTMNGWVQANAWYASIPFNAAPPPVPAGVNPQSWQSGVWQPNPMFRPQPGVAQTSVQMWAPHPGWGVPIPQHQHNPHKRVPNPGDASYWATKLSENPLGLENMHIKDPVPTTERHVKEQNGVPHTPWVWVPKELSADTSKSSHDNSAATSQAGQVQSQQTEKDLPPPPASQSSLRDHSRANSSSRDVYNSATNVYTHASQSRLTDRSVPQPAPPALSSYSTYHQQLQQLQQQESQRTPDRHHSSSQQSDAAQQRVRQYSLDVSSRPTGESQSYRDYRGPPVSASSSASAAAASRDRERTSSTREHESGRKTEAFSSQREMHLTFSPNIVRTPDHYTSPPPSRHASHEDNERTPSRTPAPQHNTYTATGTPSRAPTRSNSINTSRQSSTPGSAPTSGSTTPSASSLGLLTFTEEPQALLSPLVVGGTPPMATKSSPGRDVTRSQSYPAISTHHSVGWTTEHREREGKVYPRTPRMYDPVRSRLDSTNSSPDWAYQERERVRDVNITPQPPTRTPPTRTPPSSHYTRPSPESGSHHTRQISRSYTYPSITPANSPPQSKSPQYNSPSHSQSQQYSSNSSYSLNSSYTRTSPNANTSASSDRERERDRDRTRAISPLRHNPLPRPPAISPYAESFTRGASSASAAAAAHQRSTYKRTVRHGFWNRRGDHLYVAENGERFIVYAPRSLANPEELKQYPSPTEGWLDHRGEFMRYDPSVGELPESLPRHGEDAKRPYQQFVQYIEV